LKVAFLGASVANGAMISPASAPRSLSSWSSGFTARGFLAADSVTPFLLMSES
jgi:hypothetical protein